MAVRLFQTGVIASNSMIDVANGITMKNVSFKDCKTTGDGGAVGVWDANATFNDCIFDSCGSTNGAAVAVYNGSSIEFNNCSFNNNIATDKGGVIRIGSTVPTVKFTDCTMKGNQADMGGVIYASCPVTLEGCTSYSNTASSSGADAYIDEYGSLTVNNTLDELKALYEAVSLSYDGIYQEGKEESIETPATITGAKGLVFKSSEIQEEEPTTETPASDDGSGSGSDSADSSKVSTTNNTYNQTYNPTINNNMPQPTTAEPIQATATVSDATGQAKTYEANTADDGNSSLEIKEGENTITININVGTAETNGTGTISPTVTQVKNIEENSEPMAEGASSETVYIEKPVNWVDVAELLVICGVVLYLFKDKLKVKLQGSFRRKE